MKIPFHRTKASRGFTLIELLVVMGIIALLLAILLPALGKARATAKRVKDGTQIKQIHTGLYSMAIESSRGNRAEEQQMFPLPSHWDRRPVVIDGGPAIESPGKGDPDYRLNNHGNMYSLCVMNNAFDTSILVSTAEVSTKVVVMANYNFDAYNATGANDQYWDPNMKSNVDKDDNSALSNVSYGTLDFGRQAQFKPTERMRRYWKASQDPKFCVLGNRGVQNGDDQDASPTGKYRSSLTLNIHGGPEQWDGNLCYNDGHTSYETSFRPEAQQKIIATPPGSTQQVVKTDNIFEDQAIGSGASAIYVDTWLTMIKEVTGDGYDYNTNYRRVWD